MIPIVIPSILKAGAMLFKNNKVTVIAVAVGLFFAVSSITQCNKTQVLKKKLAVAEHNIQAANDTIRITRDKANQIEYDKLAFLTDKLSNLEKLNADLSDEVKKIKGKVTTIIQGQVQIIHDTVPLIVKGELIDSTVRADFNFNKDYNTGNSRKLAGYTKYDLRNGQSEGQLTLDEIKIKFTTGIKNLDKGKPEIFLKSDYPGFEVTALDGAVLDPGLFKAKKRSPLITTGINIGWTPATYSIKDKKFEFKPDRIGATIGININIIKLLTNKQ